MEPGPAHAQLNLVHYEREYAPQAERAAARLRHLRLWPDAVDMAIESLDRVSVPMATGLLASARGLHAQVDRAGALDDVAERARAAVDRLVAHLERARVSGSPDAALGVDNLARLLSAGESLDFDVAAMTELVERETERLSARLAAACHRLAPGVPVREVIRGLLADRPRSRPSRR